MNKLLILSANDFIDFVCAVHSVAETVTELAVCLFQCSSLDKTQLMPLYLGRAATCSIKQIV